MTTVSSKTKKIFSVVLSSIFNNDLKMGWKSMLTYDVINCEILIANTNQNGERKRLARFKKGRNVFRCKLEYHQLTHHREKSSRTWLLNAKKNITFSMDHKSAMTAVYKATASPEQPLRSCTKNEQVLLCYEEVSDIF